jgi:hypothetical protein
MRDMRKRIVAAFVAAMVCLLAAGLLAPLPATAAAEPDRPDVTTVGGVHLLERGGDTRLECWIVRNKDRGKFDRDAPRGASRSRDVYVSVTARGRHCVGRRGHHWVEPLSWTVRGDFTGDPINCNAWANFWQGLAWDFLISDGNGRDYNPPEKVTDCDEDTYLQHTFSLQHARILFYCDETPWWKTTVRLQLWGTEDPTLVLRGRLWGFSGPVKNRCV